MLSDAQLRLYRYEVMRWRAARKDRGVPAREEDRHALHRKALGRDKSSADFNNAEFDKVLAALRAEIEPENLNSQLRQLAQPEERKRSIVNRCWAAGRSFIDGNDRAHQDDLVGRYLDGMAKRMFGDYFRNLDDGQLAKVMGALESSARARKKKAAPAAVEEDVPF